MEKDYMEILLEEMRSKFDLVLEGHAALYTRIDAMNREWNEKHDLTNFMLKTLASEVADIRIDLAAHRADTEAHSRYQIRE